MPIYEFNCAKCGKDSELLVQSSRWKGAQCPHCGSTRLAKKFSTFASKGGGGGGGKSCSPSCRGKCSSC